MDPYVAVGRQKHHGEPVPSETATPSAEAGVKEKMQEKLRSAAGKVLYAARKQIIEPVFGMIKSCAVSVSSSCEGWRRCRPSGN